VEVDTEERPVHLDVRVERSRAMVFLEIDVQVSKADHGRGKTMEAPLHAAEEVVRELRLAVGDPEAGHVATEQSATVSVMCQTMRPPTIGSITLPLSETFWFGKPSEPSTHMNRPPASGSNVSRPAFPSDRDGRRYVAPNSKNSS
jgi:hypothetical protein